MKNLKYSLVVLLALFTCLTFAQTNENQGTFIAENSEDHFNPAVESTNDVSKVHNEVKEVKKNERKRIFNGIKTELKQTLIVLKDVSKQKSKSKKSGLAYAADILLVILAIFIPWLSVGIYTGWDVKLTVITALLWILGWLPGVIFGMLVLFDVIG